MVMPAEPRSIARRVSWLLLAPLCASVSLGGLVVLSSHLEGTGPDPSWTLLILVGPAIPLYLLVLPLLPFVLRALRRGWDPHPVAVLAGTFAAAGVLDLALWLGRG